MATSTPHVVHDATWLAVCICSPHLQRAAECGCEIVCAQAAAQLDCAGAAALEPRVFLTARALADGSHVELDGVAADSLAPWLTGVGARAVSLRQFAARGTAIVRHVRSSTRMLYVENQHRPKCCARSSNRMQADRAACACRIMMSRTSTYSDSEAHDREARARARMASRLEPGPLNSSTSMRACGSTYM